MIDLADIRVVAERMLRRHELLSAARSAMGPQLDMLRNAHEDVRGAPRAAEKAGYISARVDQADRRHTEFAFYAAIASLLTVDEYAVLEASHTPATPDELAERIPPETNERVRAVWRGDVVHEVVHGQAAHYRTLSGEEVVHDCGGAQECPRADCPHEPDRVLVRGYVPKYPTRAEVAERLGLSVHQVGRLVTSAYDKIRQTLEERAGRFEA